MAFAEATGEYTSCEEDDPFYDLVPDDETWMPPTEKFKDFVEEEYRKKNLPDLLGITPSQFTEIAFRMPTPDGSDIANFSFDGRRHMRRIYDTPAKRILLVCARQVEKSTLLGNKAICYSCLIPNFKTLYVSPTSTQTKTFSTDRLKEPIETSDILRAFTTRMLSQNVFEKQFVNWSKITLRNAFLNADRTRGIPSWQILIDEFQDILSDNIPVIEQSASHAPTQYQKFTYAGTPKSLDNNIEYYRGQLSTQGEWVVPCDAHGGETGRYWNILGEKNIEKKGLSCEKCHELINPQHADAKWVNMVKYEAPSATGAGTPFESYRIPQLMVPWKSWDSLLLDYARYPRAQFYNEVLGLSYDSGMRPLTQNQVKACCLPGLTMHPDYLEKIRKRLGDTPIFAGIDWGTGEHSYTVLCLGAYFGNDFRIFYIHRFTGSELEPPVQLAMLDEMLTTWKVTIIGTDYGGGFHQNDHLMRKFGPMRLAKFQYMARAKRKVEWDPKLRRYKVHRTEVMSDIFNSIKRMQIKFPRWEEFRDPYAQDMCNIFSEYNEMLRMVQYDHGQDRPDDSFHSVLYCMLASMIKFARPDIIAPMREDQNRGPVFNGYRGPQYQG